MRGTPPRLEWCLPRTEPWSDAGPTWDYGYMWWVGKPSVFEGRTMLAARGGAGHAIFVYPELDVVVVHRVNAGAYRNGWAEVIELLGRIMDARG